MQKDESWCRQNQSSCCQNQSWCSGNKLGTVQLLCWNWSYYFIHLFYSIFLSLSLKLYSSQFVSRTSTLVLATWALILFTPTFIFLHLPTPSTRATSKFNFHSLFRVVGCRVIRRAYLYGSFCFNLHSSFLEYLLPF